MNTVIYFYKVNKNRFAEICVLYLFNISRIKIQQSFFVRIMKYF